MKKKDVDAIGEALKQQSESIPKEKTPRGGIETLLGAAKAVGESANNIAKALKQDGFKSETDPLQKPFEPTIRRTQATVRVMISHEFCHFEQSITLSGDNITLIDIDNARKDCQRLCDKAIGQYRTAKIEAVKRANNSYERAQLEKEVLEINKKSEQDLTPLDKAKIKALGEYPTREYNYDDDIEYKDMGI